MGDISWKDYEIEVDLKPTESNINAGLVFRVSNPGAGVDEMSGYFAGIDNNGVVLGKMDNNWTSLSQYPMTINKEQQYHLKVKAAGNEIKVYLDDMDTPKIVFEDSSFANGKVGVRACESKTVFDNFIVKEAYGFPFEDNFENSIDSRWKTYGGTWAIEDGAYCITSGIGKVLIGENSWRNYTMEADIKVSDTAINSGLVVNVTNPGTGPDEMRGYFVGLNSEGIILGKMDNDWTEIQSAAMAVSTNVWYHMKVQLRNGEISVFVDDMDTPKIVVTDLTFLCGKAGMRAFDCKTYFDNIVIY